MPVSLITRILVLILLLMAGFAVPSPAGEGRYWLWKPGGWQDGEPNPRNSLVRQIIEPSRNALIELYSYEINNPGLAQLADRWEAKARRAGAAYVQQRGITQPLILAGPANALMRHYTGNQNGVRIASRVIYTYHAGRAYVIMGSFVKSAPGMKDKVEEVVTSLRFIPPNQPAAQGGQAVLKKAPAQGPKAAGPGSRDFQWMQAKAWGLWMPKPKKWSLKQKISKGNLDLEISSKRKDWGLLMVMVRNLGMNMSPGQVMDIWEQKKDSSTLTNLDRRVALSGPAQIDSHRPGSPLILREYLGQIEGFTTRTYLGCATRKNLAYMVMAIFPEGNQKVDRLLQQCLMGFRLVPPPQHNFDRSAGVINVGN
jgi:hypothetical protein